MKKLIIVWSAFCLLACSRSPEPELFELASVPPRYQGVRTVQGMSIGIDSVIIPDYLDQKEIIVFTTPTQGQYTRLGQWAESPQNNIQNVMAGDLQAYLPNARILLSPWSLENAPTQKVVLRIQDAKLFADGRVILSANYKILSGNTVSQGKTYAVHYQYKLIAPNLSSEIQALNGLMHRLSRHIAQHLNQG